MLQRLLTFLLMMSLALSAIGCENLPGKETDIQQTKMEKPAIETPQAISTEPEQKGPFKVDKILLVNRYHPLPKNYSPKSFADVGNGQTLTSEAAAAFQEMAAHCLKETNCTLVPLSGYRSYERQKELYENYKSIDGANAENYSAPPGFSEHQTGLAIDIGDRDLPEENLEISFSETTAGQWLEHHASQYGFILRYPKGKENFTGYQYEPWHFRYVGAKVAQKMATDNSLTLESFLGDTTSYPQGFDNNRRIAAQKNYHLTLDQREKDIAVYTVKGRIYLPLRQLALLSKASEHPFHLVISEKTGRIRVMPGPTKDITSTVVPPQSHRSTVLVKPAPYFYSDGTSKEVKTFVLNGHTYVELRSFADLLNWKLKAQRGLITLETKAIPTTVQPPKAPSLTS